MLKILTGKEFLLVIQPFGFRTNARFGGANVGSIPVGTTYDSYVKRVSQRSAESRGFSPGTPVSSHKEC